MKWSRFLTFLVVALVATLSPVTRAGAQSCVSPPQGLVSWWSAEGNADDVSGLNNGTLQGGAAFAPGFVNRAFSLNGVDQFVEIPANASLNLPAFSVEAWIFMDPALTAGQFNNIIGKGSGGSGERGFFFAHDDRHLPSCPPNVCGESVNGLTFSVFGGPAIRSFGSIADAFPAAGFYHVAGTFDGHTARLYKNGSLVSTGATIGGVGFNAFPIRIGALFAKEWYQLEDRYMGLIDEVGLYNRALDSAEIRAIFDAGSAGKCDTRPPTWPAGSALMASDVGLTSLTLTWTPAADNVRVTAYRLLRDGALQATFPATVNTYQATGLISDTHYVFKVDACDGTKNCSTDGPSLDVLTLSPQQEIQATVDTIDGLVDSGAVPPGPANSLVATLEGVSRQLASGNVNAAIARLNAFVRQVTALITAGSISPADGQPLIDAANETIAILG